MKRTLLLSALCSLLLSAVGQEPRRDGEERHGHERGGGGGWGQDGGGGRGGGWGQDGGGGGRGGGWGQDGGGGGRFPDRGDSPGDFQRGFPGGFPERGGFQGNDGFQGHEGFQEGFPDHHQGGYSDYDDYQNQRHRNRDQQAQDPQPIEELTLVGLFHTNVSRLHASPKHGVPCKDPQQQEGICSYISDPLCAPFKTALNDDRKQLYRMTVAYIRRSNKAPCGYDGTDLTMCCPQQPSPNPEQPPPPPPTTTVPPAPSTTIPPAQPTVLPQVCGIRGTELGQPKPTEIELYIIGGTDAPKASWPWAAVLGQPQGTGFKVVCGGTLITNQHVLTAAHCFPANPTAATKITHVRLGEQDLSKVTPGITPVDVEICNVRKNEKFVIDTMEVNDDVTVLKLCKPVEFGTFIQPACLPAPDAATPGSLKIVGWGSDHAGGGAVSILKEADVVPVALTDCQQEYMVIGLHLDSTHICAGKGATDTCAGDSGGPLLSQVNGKWTIVGITSFGVGCASDKFPGVYTNVAQFLDWIKEKLN